jgi:hypothetical protein
MSTAVAEKTEAPPVEAEKPLKERRKEWAAVLGEKEQRADALRALMSEASAFTDRYHRPIPEDLERRVAQARTRLDECERSRVRLMDTADSRQREHFRELARERKALSESIAREESRQADFTRRVTASIATCEKRARAYPEATESIELDKCTVSSMRATVEKFDRKLRGMRERLIEVKLEAEVARAKMLRP